MKQYTLAAAAGAMMFICGCQSSSQPTAAEQEILSQLKEINASLKEIAKSTPSASAPSPDSGFVPVKSDSAKLAKIKPLPDNPTDADIRSYIEAIQTASVGQNNFTPGDPQVGLYRKIGTGHFKVWLPYLGGEHNNNYHLYSAAPSLLSDEDKAEAIKQLSSYPNLADAIVKKGWGNDAKDGIFTIAAATNNPYMLMQVLKTYTKTPEDRQRLTDLYLKRSEFADLYKTVSLFEGADAGKLAQTAWENQKFNSNNWNRVVIATRAASFGNKDALGAAINAYASQPNDYIDQDTAMLLTQATGQILNKQALRKWYLDNQDKLVYNAEKRRFEVK